MPNRKERDDDDLDRIFAECQDLAELYHELQGIQGITVHPDGSGKCVFKVYLAGHEGFYQGFLRVFRHESNGDVKAYVQWQHCEFPDLCHEIWQGIVKSPDNADGSYLQKGIGNETLLRHVKRYVKQAELRKSP